MKYSMNKNNNKFVKVVNCIRKYDSGGEILKDEIRTSRWIKDFVFKNDKYNWDEYSSILDIGSGNGRLNQVYKNYFSRIYNIERSLDIDERFCYDNVIVYKEDFYDFAKRIKSNETKTGKVVRFDIIILVYAFRSLQFKYMFMKSILRLLNKNGMIIILESDSFEKDKKKGREFFDLNKLSHEFGLSIDRYNRRNTNLSFLKIDESKIDKNYKSKFNWCMYCGSFSSINSFCEGCKNGKEYPNIEFKTITI